VNALSNTYRLLLLVRSVHAVVGAYVQDNIKAS
jgi:hypothetical protein